MNSIANSLGVKEPPDRTSADHRTASCPCPELLAPAGDWECAKAAVENGADAVYFGLDRFNARMRAHNFTVADLPQLVDFLHRRGVKGYVAFNILTFANELAEAERCLRAIIAAGVDAAIVQDPGICRLIRRLSPDFPIHASTQMTISSAAGLRFARELGCSMVALARECSLAEIEKMQAEPPNGVAADPIGLAADGGSANAMPIEIFIHGALCVAYSGQCLTSESLGGRSANRGVCAQACRLPYGLICDGQSVPLGDRRYLLSPRDLAGLEVLPAVIQAGIHTVKIEGRLKKPEYVANITRLYRQALDGVWAAAQAARPEMAGETVAGEGVGPDSPAQARAEHFAAESRYDMEMAFSRGLYTGWLRGSNNQELVHARFGKKRGVYLGEIERIQNRRVAVRLEASLKPGDGVVFDAGHPDQPEEGGRVYAVEPQGPVAWLSFGHDDLDYGRLTVGDKVWKTNDPELERRLRQSYAGDQPRFQRPVHLEVKGFAGQPMTVTICDQAGHQVEVVSRQPLVAAANQPLEDLRLREHLGRLGGTAFRLGSLRNLLEGRVILPVSELNRLRRAWVHQLETLCRQPNHWTLNAEADVGSAMMNRIRKMQVPCERSGAVLPTDTKVIVLVRDLAQLETVLRAGVETVYCEFEDPKKYAQAVRLVREWGSEVAEVWVAPPRITKPGEGWILRQVRAANADGYLVRNYDHLEFFAGERCVGDFSLNIANPLSAEYFMRRFGLERVTASYDLNINQLEALLQNAPPHWFEVTLHQHTPMFHMEHCVFCAFLSTGKDYHDCGRPCDQHGVSLRDRVGVDHPVKADAGCRNTVFNGRAQTGAEFFQRLQALGARAFRLEFLTETPELAAQTLAKYRALFRGEITGAQLWRDLKLLNYLGVTRGPMDQDDM